MQTIEPVYRSALQRSAVVLAVFFQIAATSLPSLGVGEPIGDQSDDVRTLITPVGWAFSIWGPLYLGSIAFAVYQALPAQHRNSLLNQIAWPAAAAFTGNGLWALYTQLNDLTFVSVLIIATTLGALLVIYRRLASWPQQFTVGERWCAVLPLSALAAWLTAATIVNVSSSLTYHEVITGPPLPILAAVVVGIGGVIASLAVLRGAGNPWYAGVFLWALLGIYYGGGQEAPAVGWAAVGSAVLVAVSALIALRDKANRARWFR